MGTLWTEQVSVGNAIIDSDHKELIATVNGAEHAIKKRDDFALLQAFDLSGNFLYTYFPVEENIAQAINFDFSQHRLAHQNLLNEFQRMKDWFAAKNDAWSKFEEAGCINSLKNYLVQHIKEGGEPLKIVPNTHFYDFNP